MNLVIVESPAKCSKIQGYLGDGYKVIATMGHIRALEQTLDAVGIGRDFEPMYTFIESKAKALKQLKDCAKEAKKIYLASDDDREGEAISYSICAFLKLDPRVTPRIVFHEITEKAIKHAVNNPRLVDMDRVHAQQARSMLDMMIGFTMSPLLWKHVAMGLSAGRCQTPALRLVVEREENIKNFSSATSWKLRGQWNTEGGFEFGASMNDDLEDEESAGNYLEMLQDPVTGKVLSNTVKPWSLSAPLPLITSTLQQQASALFSIPPKSCMASAQRLYEGGHITYMRTDKAVLSEEAQEGIRGFILEKYGEDYAKEVKKGGGAEKEDMEEQDEEEKDDKKKKKGAKKVSKKKKGKDEEEGTKAQEAHEAIRPTHIEVTSLPEGDWTASDKKIYGLIWQRAVQSMMTNAKGENCIVHFISDACEDFPWSASWRRTIFAGWQIIGRIADIDAEGGGGSDEEDSKENEWKKAISIKKDSEISWKQLVAEPHESRAPTRYTEATLVRELEKHGIGRPSTFASLIATIQDKGYVECKNIPGRDIEIKTYTVNVGIWPAIITKKKKTVGAEKQKLVPTDLGRTSLRFMLEHFDDLFNYSFTGKMENRLDSIAEGNEPWKGILRDMWESYKDRYEELKKGGSVKSSSEGGAGSGKIIEFGDGYKAVLSKKGPLILFEPESKEEKVVFYGWPEGVAFQDITKEIALEFIKKKKKDDSGIGEWRGEIIIKKTGKFGPYVQAGDIIVSVSATDTLEQIIEKLDKKADVKKEDKGALKVFKEFEIHNGPYGPYIIKPKLKQRKFISLPKTITIDTLTEAEVEALYKAGLEKKNLASKFKKRSGDGGKN